MKGKFIMMGVMVCCWVACKKEGEYPKGNATAQLNVSTWETIPVCYQAVYNPQNRITIYFYKNKGLTNEEFLNVDNIKKELGKQSIFNNIPHAFSGDTTCGVFITSQDVDITGDEYSILESDSANNWIEITSADDNFSKNIKGNFSATLYRTHTYQGSPNPDTIRLRNGTFYISKLKE